MSNRKEERRAERRKRKAARKKRRVARRTERRTRRQKRRESKGTLRMQIAEKVEVFLNREFEKIQEEKLQAQAAGDSLQQSTDPTALIKRYAIKALVQGAKSGLLPGFVGMVTLLPEIAGNVKNQLRMVYDLGVANGYPPETHKDIIIYVFLDALGKKLTGFGIIQGNKILVRPNSESTLKSIVKIIAGYVVSQLVRSLVCKWLPGIGSAAMMAWAHHSIIKISGNANSLFQHEIILDETKPTTLPPEVLETVEEQVLDDHDDDADFIKFLALIDLMRQDGKIQPKEKGLFLEMLQNSDFEEDEKEELYEMLESEEDIDPDLTYFQEKPEETLALIFDLVALAKADENLHVKEAGYLFDTAEELNFPTEQLIQLLEN